MGFAEQQSAEIFRPPTWHDNSELDDDGYYVRGPRVPTPDGAREQENRRVEIRLE